MVHFHSVRILGLTNGVVVVEKAVVGRAQEDLQSWRQDEHFSGMEESNA